MDSVSLVVEPLMVQLVPCATFFPCSIHFVHPITRKKQAVKSCSSLPSPQGNQLLFLLNFVNSEDRMHVFCISLHYAKYALAKTGTGAISTGARTQKTTMVPSDISRQALVAFEDGHVPPCQLFGASVEFYMKILQEAPNGRQFVLDFSFSPQPHQPYQLEMAEVKSDPFSVYRLFGPEDRFQPTNEYEVWPQVLSVTMLDQLPNAGLPNPSANTRSKAPVAPPYCVNGRRCLVKLANYVSGLTYCLGRYKLPVIFENEADQSVICLVPSQPPAFIESYLAQFYTIELFAQGLTERLDESQNLSLVLLPISQGKYLVPSTQYAMVPFQNTLFRLFNSLEDSLSQTGRDDLAEFCPLLRDLLSERVASFSDEEYASLANSFLEVLNEIRSMTNSFADLPVSVVQEVIQLMIGLGWISEEMEWNLAGYFPSCHETHWIAQPNQFVDRLLPWSLDAGRVLFFPIYTSRRIALAQLESEQKKSFGYVTTPFGDAGKEKDNEKKQEVIKRPAGSVQRLLKQLENKDEAAIIENLKKANRFEDYEHLLYLEAEEQGELEDEDEVDRMLRKKEREENFNAQDTEYEEDAEVFLPPNPQILRDLTLQNNRGESIILDDYNISQIDELVLDETQLNPQLSQFLTNRNFIIEPFEQVSHAMDGTFTTMRKVRASRKMSPEELEVLDWMMQEENEYLNPDAGFNDAAIASHPASTTMTLTYSEFYDVINAHDSAKGGSDEFDISAFVSGGFTPEQEQEQYERYAAAYDEQQRQLELQQQQQLQQEASEFFESTYDSLGPSDPSNGFGDDNNDDIVEFDDEQDGEGDEYDDDDTVQFDDSEEDMIVFDENSGNPNQSDGQFLGASDGAEGSELPSAMYEYMEVLSREKQLAEGGGASKPSSRGHPKKHGHGHHEKSSSSNKKRLASNGKRTNRTGREKASSSGSRDRKKVQRDANGAVMVGEPILVDELQASSPPPHASSDPQQQQQQQLQQQKSLPSSPKPLPQGRPAAVSSSPLNSNSKKQLPSLPPKKQPSPTQQPALQQQPSVPHSQPFSPLQPQALSSGQPVQLNRGSASRPNPYGTNQPAQREGMTTQQMAGYQPQRPQVHVMQSPTKPKLTQSQYMQQQQRKIQQQQQQQFAQQKQQQQIMLRATQKKPSATSLNGADASVKAVIGSDGGVRLVRKVSVCLDLSANPIIPQTEKDSEQQQSQAADADRANLNGASNEILPQQSAPVQSSPSQVDSAAVTSAETPLVTANLLASSANLEPKRRKTSVITTLPSAQLQQQQQPLASGANLPGTAATHARADSNAIPPDSASVVNRRRENKPLMLPSTLLKPHLQASALQQAQSAQNNRKVVVNEKITSEMQRLFQSPNDASLPVAPLALGQTAALYQLLVEEGTQEGQFKQWAFQSFIKHLIVHEQVEAYKFQNRDLVVKLIQIDKSDHFGQFCGAIFSTVAKEGALSAEDFCRLVRTRKDRLTLVGLQSCLPVTKRAEAVPPNLFHIAFPDGQKKIVKFTPDLPLLPILTKICSQRQTSFEEYTCYDVYDSEFTVTPGTLMSAATDRFVQLLVRERSGSARGTAEGELGEREGSDNSNKPDREQFHSNPPQPALYVASIPLHEPQQQQQKDQQQQQVAFSPKNNVSPRAYTAPISPANSAKVSLRTSNSSTVQLSQIRSASPVVLPKSTTEQQNSNLSPLSSATQPQLSAPVTPTPNLHFISPALTTIPSTSNPTQPNQVTGASHANASPTATNVIPPYLRSINLHAATSDLNQQSNNQQQHQPGSVIPNPALTTNNLHSSYYHPPVYQSPYNPYATTSPSSNLVQNPNIPQFKPNAYVPPNHTPKTTQQQTQMAYGPLPSNVNPNTPQTPSFHATPYNPPSSSYPQDHSSPLTSPISSPLTSPRPMYQPPSSSQHVHNPMLTPDMAPKPHLRPQMNNSGNHQLNRASSPTPKSNHLTHGQLQQQQQGVYPTGGGHVNLRDSNPHVKASYHDEQRQLQQQQYNQQYNPQQYNPNQNNQSSG